MSVPSLPFLAKTRVAWTGEQDGDLGFLENEVVNVFNIVDDSWWQGSLSRNGAEGIFPKDFVEVVSTPSSSFTTPTKSASKSNVSPNKSFISPSNAFIPSSSRYNGRNSHPSTPSKLDKRATDNRSSMVFTPTKASNSSPGYRTSASKSTPAFDDFNTSYEEHNNSFSNSMRAKKSPSHFYSQHVLSSGLTKAHTSDNLLENKRLSQIISPDTSPVKMRMPETSPFRRSNGLSSKTTPDINTSHPDEFYQSIVQKKQELEMQLNQLKELERNHMSRKANHSAESSYISEDLLSSKRNFMSKDDLGRKLEEVEQFEQEEDVPPPPPPKHNHIPCDADDFKGSGATFEDRLRASLTLQEELKNSVKSLQSDVLNLSELSATSAGSYSRHKFEREQLNHSVDHANPELSVGNLSLDETEDLVNSVFKNRKAKQANIFKKFMKKKPEQNLMEQRLHQEPDDWQKVKSDLNRMNTLTSSDKQTRTKRVTRSEANFIVKPLEYVTDINTSETFGPDEFAPKDLRFNSRKVSEFSKRYDSDCDFNDIISDISVKFGTSKPDQIRAVLMHLCKFKILDEEHKISQSKPRLHEVMAKGEATIFQLNYLFKKLLEALRIPSEVVLGFWKKPNDFYHSDQFSVNHCWLSVMIETDIKGNGCFRLIDLVCFKNGSICNIDGYNEFYFLTAPIDVVSTHIPSVIELQHVCPPIDLNIAFHLPRLYSSFGKCGLKFINFNNALTRMHDSEFFETDIELPQTVELFTLIKTSHKTSNDFTLCQIYWKDERRIAKIKAVLPRDDDIGVLQIFAGQKGLQTHFDNIHELACVIPLYHSGDCEESTFVARYPTIRSLNNDLYVHHPQLSSISFNNNYNFEVGVHPSMGLNSGSGLMNQDFKLVIESPSGKYTKLVNQEPHKPFGIYQSKLFCSEKGSYRGLVIGDSGNSWYVFAQWECVGI